MMRRRPTHFSAPQSFIERQTDRGSALHRMLSGSVSLFVSLPLLLTLSTAGTAFADDASDVDVEKAIEQMEDFQEVEEVDEVEEMAEEISDEISDDATDGEATTVSLRTTTLPTSEELLTGMAKAQDALLIRPLAAAKVVLGAVFMIPATIFSAPSGLEGIQASYEVLIDAPAEYAFRRPLGEF